jgi:hypothetical protein
MRSALLVMSVISVGCAGVTAAPERAYRVATAAARPAVGGGEGGSTTYVVQLEGGVEYGLDASETAGVVRLRIAIRNAGRELVRYDPARVILAAADGVTLRPVAGEEAYHRDGVRTVAPGQRIAIARRYSFMYGFRRERDLLLLARLLLEDVIQVGEREAQVKLRLEEVR